MNIEGKGVIFNKDNTIYFEGEFLNNKKMALEDYITVMEDIMKEILKMLKRLEKVKFMIKMEVLLLKANLLKV
jgi:hypothetical protein